MIPPDVASSLRQILPDRESAGNTQTQPVPAAQRIADALSNFVPGQRILAEIQAILPNGAYRAIVAQREVTLALPFSAKAGDTLELEVAESDGKLTLAFVADRSNNAAGKALPESVTTSLSSAGKMIGNLLNELSADGKRAPPAPLNGNQALVETMPKVAATDLAPVLQQALTKSGMFYEAHQARWVAGEVPTSMLREEPQGKTAPTTAPVFATIPDTGPELAAKIPLAGQAEANPPSQQASTPTPTPANIAADKPDTNAPGNLLTPRSEQASPSTSQTGNPVPRELAPIVQQQLDALATQNYAWQGQIWPGQKLWWEISDNPNESRSANDEDAGGRWQTRLKLSLPSLGGIDTVLRLLPGGKVDITMTTDSPSGETRLRENAASLQEHLKSAGIDLTQFSVRHGETAE